MNIEYRRNVALFNLILTMYLIEENAYKVGLDIQYRNNK